ncbi:MAG: inorganic phosphate transporter [Planctomycetaceae bacterium]|nr:inorganic phosphate transporter [Planctomycetaceae bacterium]
MTIVVLVVVMALLFDFLNGMNDAANSIATVVSTRVLTPMQAVAWAAFFNFIAAFGLGTEVANTIAKIVHSDIVTLPMVLAALSGAILWTHLCTKAGLPISVSHALIGGVVGAALAKAGMGEGWRALNHASLTKTAVFIVVSPVAGLVGAVLLSLAQSWVFRNATRQKVGKIFRWGQLASSGAFALSHGASDAQKTMGIMVLALVAGGQLAPDYEEVPTWVVLSAHGAISLGTMAGGWAVIHTMGTKLTKLQPAGGFCAETSGAAVCLGTAIVGIPVSTTHTITGAIMGVGAAHRLGAVRWGLAGRILWAWVLTIPCSALVSALTWWGLAAASGI